MSESKQRSFEQFPEGVIEIVHGVIQQINPTGQGWLTDVTAPMEVPPSLLGCISQREEEGTFVHGGVYYCFMRMVHLDHTLIFFRPAPPSALTSRQLDSFLQQMRGLMQEMLMEVQWGRGHPDLPMVHRMDSFSKSFCRVYRLLTNLEFLQQMGSPEGIPFAPVTMDLVPFCSRLVAQAGDLLILADIRLFIQSSIPSALILGDEDLLCKLLLTLISNSALTTHSGEIGLQVQLQEQRVLLSLSSQEQQPCPPALDHLYPPAELRSRPPAPHEGAGMGLAIARHIVALHGGIMLANQIQEGSVTTTLSFPLTTPELRQRVCSPQWERGGGISPFLLELSDLLPASLFDWEE